MPCDHFAIEDGDLRIVASGSGKPDACPRAERRIVPGIAGTPIVLTPIAGNAGRHPMSATPPNPAGLGAVRR